MNGKIQETYTQFFAYSTVCILWPKNCFCYYPAIPYLADLTVFHRSHSIHRQISLSLVPPPKFGETLFFMKLEM